MQNNTYSDSIIDEHQLKQLQTLFATKHSIASLNKIIPFMRWGHQSFLQLLITRESCHHLLVKVFRFIPQKFKYAFLVTVFQNRAIVPRTTLYFLLYKMLLCNHFESINTLKRLFTARQKKNTCDTPKSREKALLAIPQLTSPLLIDYLPVCQLYCLAQKPGWELLRHIPDLRIWKNLRLSMPLQQALQEDSVPAFSISCGMSKQGMSYSLLTRIIQAGASSIFRHLLGKGEIPSSIITLPELCCMLTVQQPDNITVPFLSALEEFHPGLLKGTQDALGRNLLWYSVHNYQTGWFHPKCQLTHFLLEKGCDPQNTNPLGLSWQEFTDSLSVGNKQLLMNQRYYFQAFCNPGSQLRVKQPLSDIA